MKHVGLTLILQWPLLPIPASAINLLAICVPTSYELGRGMLLHCRAEVTRNELG